jgi:hypothetical protein
MGVPSRADYLLSVETASEAVLVGMDTSVDDDGKTRADTANVQVVSQIDYAEAIDNYAARDDVEPLSQRRARDAAATPAGQDFTRAETYDGGFSADPGANNPYV